MLSILDIPKQTDLFLTSNRNKIQPDTRIIVTFQTDGPAMVDVWVVLVHCAFSDFIHFLLRKIS